MTVGNPPLCPQKYKSASLPPATTSPRKTQRSQSCLKFGLPSFIQLCRFRQSPRLFAEFCSDSAILGECYGLVANSSEPNRLLLQHSQSLTNHRDRPCIG